MARSRIDLRNMMARAAIVGKRRSQDDELFAEELLFDHEELEHIKRARNTGPRPGGTNATGRKNYAESTWARMLRDQSAQLKSHTSPESKVFRNRFRVLEWPDLPPHVTEDLFVCKTVKGKTRRTKTSKDALAFLNKCRFVPSMSLCP